MFGLLARLIPVLFLAAILGSFMAADKLWLHWYTPDTGSSSLALERTVQVNASEQTQQQPTLALGPQTGDVQTPTPGPSPQSRDAFTALWVAGQQATYQVRYETSSDSGEKGDSYAIFNLPPLARVDTVPQGSNGPSSQIVVNGQGTTIACSSDATGRRCAPISPFNGPLPLTAGPIIFPAASTFATFDVTETEGRIIAGAPARCFELVSTQDARGTELDYCFSSAGVPLYSRGPSGIVETSQVTSDVSPAAFFISTS